MPNIMGFLFGYEQTLEEEKRLEGVKPVIQISRNWVFRTFLSLFESFLLKSETRDSMGKKEQEQRDKEEAKKAYEEFQGLQRSETLKKKNLKVEEKKTSPE